MDSPYDSDVSEDTRDLISRGLATDNRKYSVEVDLGIRERDSAPTRSMSTSYVHLPLTHVVKAAEPSARGFNMTSGENVKGQNYNIYMCVFSPHGVLIVTVLCIMPRSAADELVLILY